MFRLTCIRTLRVGLAVLALIIAHAALSVPASKAQVLYGSVSGVVTDQSGAAVPKAHVIITNRGTGFVRETDANEGGHYTIPDLPPGAYDLKVTAGGFKPLTQTNLIITANNITNADVGLQVGAVTEQVI